MTWSVKPQFRLNFPYHDYEDSEMSYRCSFMHGVCIQTKLNCTYIRRCLNVHLQSFTRIHMHTLHGGFLKWTIPKSPWVSIAKWSNELDDLGYDSNRWAVAQPGDFSANRAIPLAAVSALLLAPWLKTEVYMELTLVSRWSCHVRSITFLRILMGESYPSVCIFIFSHFLYSPYFL